jgi:hypothetical protein
MAITLRRAFGMAAVDLATASRAALDVPLEGDAELWAGSAREEAIALGAFERDVGSASQRTTPPSDGRLRVRRGSGGPSVRLGPGTLWVALLLPRVDALVDCDEKRIVNRYVRPLLRALTRAGAPAHYFGRDWISVKHRPAAWIGFAHDATTGRVLVESFIARETPFAASPRASFLDKVPGTLAEITGTPVAEDRLTDAVARAFAEMYGQAVVDGGADLAPHVKSGMNIHSASSAKGEGPLPGGDLDGAPANGDALSEEPPWTATTEEAIGLVGAGLDAAGRFRVGGDFLASRDAVAALENELPATRDDGLGSLLDRTLGAPHVALDGIRSLASLRDVILAARTPR